MCKYNNAHWSEVLLYIIFLFQCTLSVRWQSSCCHNLMLATCYQKGSTVESYFGQQRSRGQRNDNPSEQQFLQNAQAIIIQKSLVSGASSTITKKRANLVHCVGHFLKEDVLELLEYYTL